jgi:hypothetical protein
MKKAGREVRTSCPASVREQRFDSTTLHLQKLMEDAEMLADVKACDAAKARLEDGSDELIPLEITERSLRESPRSARASQAYSEAAREEGKSIARADCGD